MLKEINKSMSNKTLAEVYNIHLINFDDFLITSNVFSTHTRNCLLSENITTAKTLLEIPIRKLFLINGLGDVCWYEIEDFCKKIKSSINEIKKREENLAKIYNIDSNNYSDVLILSINFSVRTKNCLFSEKIKTVKELLELSPQKLMSIKSFGSTCLQEIEKFCKDLGKENKLIPKPKYKKISKIFLDHSLEIARCNFSFLENYDLNDEEKKEISKYKKAYEILGEDLAILCVENDSSILEFSRVIKEFSEISKYHFKIKKFIEKLPNYKKCNKAFPYINIYTSDKELRENLYKISRKEGLISEMPNNIDYNDKKSHVELTKFLEWCNFNLNEEIENLFSILFKKEREKEIVEARANNKTLVEIGNFFGVTRERVRQIEVKVKEKFSYISKKYNIILKISAEENGNEVITYNNIYKYIGENSKILVFLLEECENLDYVYDKEIQAFIIGNNPVKERLENYISTLPNIISENQLIEIIKDLENRENISEEIFKNFFNNIYKITGSVYHCTRLSLYALYKNILKKYYPTGINVYDPVELEKFKTLIKKEYGDVEISPSNRALTARIVEICVLCDRGRYKLKQEKYISEELECKIINYINTNKNTIFMINTIFSIFEKELMEEGINNKYYLQGILRELYSDRFTFTRDYISKDPSITSIHSSIIEYVKNSKYTVSNKQLKREFPGITQIVYCLALSDEHILNYFGEYLHSNNLKIFSEEKEYLYDLVLEILVDDNPHHCKEIYEKVLIDNEELLTRNSIYLSFSFFSVLEYLFKENFEFSRPYIFKKGVKLQKVENIIKDIIYTKDEVPISKIKNLAQKYYFHINSTIELINSWNDEFLLINNEFIKKITSIGINEEIAQKIEDIILNSLNETLPIRDLLVWNKLPKLKVPWTEWLLYSIINKWGKKLEVAINSNQFRHSIPLIAPFGKMSILGFTDITPQDKNTLIKVEDLDDINNLLEELIDDDLLLEDIEDYEF